MSAPYATLVDLRAHWAALPVTREPEATQKLVEASTEIRALYPDLDARITAAKIDADIPRLVVNRMVKRAMDIPDNQTAGINQVQNTAGPFGQTLSFTNPDGNVYLSKADKALLGAGRSGRKAFTVYPPGVV